MSALLEQTLSQLQNLGDEKVRAQNRKRGVDDCQYGVQLGDIRKLATSIKADHPLALALWGTGNMDAQLLAILLVKPKQLSVDDINRLVRSIKYVQVADWFSAYVLKQHPNKENLRQQWMLESDPWLARAGWSLTYERIVKSPQGLNPDELLDRIQQEMPSAAPVIQWTMNMCLAGIGIHCPDYRARALNIGESLGLYRDYPVSKGCTSPFAPIWIHAMVARST